MTWTNFLSFSCFRYGLILPGKDKPNLLTFQASRNVFGNDSDSDDETSKRPVLLRPSHNINRQVTNYCNSNLSSLGMSVKSELGV